MTIQHDLLVMPGDTPRQAGVFPATMLAYGVTKIKPWDHKVTVVIPHLGTYDEVAVGVELWRRQTVKPYIYIIDTGSSFATLQKLETLRDHDLEVHMIASHGYQHPARPVAVAMDLAFSLCPTEFLFATHSDVFPRRQDLLEWYLTLCPKVSSVVGYQMSLRLFTNLWMDTPSHTATMFHMPTMQENNITWNFQRAVDLLGFCTGMGWPDTESNIGLSLRRCGIVPYFIGVEPNYVALRDANIVHVRSFASSKVYLGGFTAIAQTVMNEELAAAKQRIVEWSYPVASPNL